MNSILFQIIHHLSSISYTFHTLCTLKCISYISVCKIRSVANSSPLDRGMVKSKFSELSLRLYNNTAQVSQRGLYLPRLCAYPDVVHPLVHALHTKVVSKNYTRSKWWWDGFLCSFSMTSAWGFVGRMAFFTRLNYLSCLGSSRDGLGWVSKWFLFFYLDVNGV